ncbi:alanine-tRNA synthetase second additional domain-containing protein [Vallitalea okinawensis]|uniref:alanine-tRNA synthetase second additional domain-containing protein n=1 Tax=Vallitalea okinawensis TaxID=2078660 RepID=UPI000CFD82B7|nr:alanine-tRNA synthetase second additional domain-containing protein [Vallitalea okinawensis]
MPVSLVHESLMYSAYFAPRGVKRLLNLGHNIAQRYLTPLDKLIGVIGEAGSGKSMLIKGMFPGLELTNDDDGINVRPLPLLENLDEDYKFGSHTYHLDIRFEMAFTQVFELAEAIRKALENGKRVIVEHFELIYPYLGINAEMLIGIGEEIIIARPTIFGPLPDDIGSIVHKSIKYRKMAHSAEEITCNMLKESYNLSPHSNIHGDVKHGFVLGFDHEPNINIGELEQKIHELYINKAVDISYVDDQHIALGDEVIFCTGPRIHVQNTKDIKNFHLIKEFRYEPLEKTYNLIGLVGCADPIDINDINKL